MSETLQQKQAKRWESYIRKECKALNKVHRALVDKNWEAPRVPGKKMPREKSKPDFSGILPGGVHISFEAKATLSTTSFPFSSVAKHQAEHLAQVEEFGGLAFLYVLDGHDDKWVLPWAVIRRAGCDRSSFALHDDSPFKKRAGETWLDALERVGFLGGTP